VAEQRGGEEGELTGRCGCLSELEGEMRQTDLAENGGGDPREGKEQMRRRRGPWLNLAMQGDAVEHGRDGRLPGEANGEQWLRLPRPRGHGRVGNGGNGGGGGSGKGEKCPRVSGGSRGPVGGFIASGEQARRRRPVSSTCSDRPGRYREGDERGIG
jgi:hypothetical protein